jgi:uncharacterized protein
VHVSGLFIYPVKSLRGCSVERAEGDALGFVGDRRFLVADEFGRFLTQRTLPRMACILTSLTAKKLQLSAEGVGSMEVSRESDPSAPLRTVNVWKSEGLQAEDCGASVAQWLSDFLGHNCRLVRIGPAFRRQSLKAAAREGDSVSFADSAPFLVISEASLADLNRRLVGVGEPPLPMNRFRPNLVVTSSAPYVEDTWDRVRIGELVFRAAGPCSRCPITTTDQQTGQRGKEPLRMLASYRRDLLDSTDVNFGQNLIHETKTGTVRLGDRVDLV